MSRQKFDILSPDGFSIKAQGYFSSISAARKAFNKWLANYKRQGYYSSVKYGKIDLSNVEEYCTLVEV